VISTCMSQSYPKQHRKSTKNTVSFHDGHNSTSRSFSPTVRKTPSTPNKQTLGASAPYVTGRAFDHDFEHLPPRETRNDLVS
ncbi:MAG: hypothetical protein ACFN04_06450, partial [Propionibacterium acidifaciens]